jgi:acyl-CoA thioesterase YciA
VTLRTAGESEEGTVDKVAAREGDPRQPAIRVILMPKDTNALGTIFGGIILSYIDQAGAVEAHRHTTQRVVTVAMREVVFHQPVFVGDLVSFYTETVRLGKTSITVKVTVEAERARTHTQPVKVTEAEVVFVQVDEKNRPLSLPERK